MKVQRGSFFRYTLFFRLPFLSPFLDFMLLDSSSVLLSELLSEDLLLSEELLSEKLFCGRPFGT